MVFLRRKFRNKALLNFHQLINGFIFRVHVDNRTRITPKITAREIKGKDGLYTRIYMYNMHHASSLDFLKNRFKHFFWRGVEGGTSFFWLLLLKTYCGIF